MILTQHETEDGRRWAVDGCGLPRGISLSTLLELGQKQMLQVLDAVRLDTPINGAAVAPIEQNQEVWAAGVTYMRSREARMSESDTADVYDKVYDADRVEVFFKALGFRVAGPGQPIRIRKDSNWNVPEPELTLVLNATGQIVGYCAGNDVSSRDIEGANPLYLPQAKVYDRSAAVGPAIVLCQAEDISALPIKLSIKRAGEEKFSGETNTSQLKRTPVEIANWLTRELSFPNGVFIMTGTGIVPPDEFTLEVGDVVDISVGSLSLSNPVTQSNY